MNELFLDELELQKAELYEAFLDLTVGSYPDTYLNKEIELTAAKIQTLLAGIQTDLEQLVDGPVTFFADDQVVVAETLPTSVVYQQFLLMHALPTKVFQSLLLRPQETVKEFCQENFFSRATVFRKLQALQPILAPFHLQLNISQLQLVGSEISIRYFLCNMLWALSPRFLDDYALTETELAGTIEDVVTAFDEHTAFGTREKIIFAIKIAELRRRGGFFADRLIDTHQLPIKRGIILRNAARFTAELKKTTEPIDMAAEEACFYFLIFTGPIYLSPHTDSYKMLESWYNRQGPPQKIIRRFSTLIVQDFFHGRRPPRYNIILANILSVFNTSYILRDTPPLIVMMTRANLTPDNRVYAKLEEFCQKYLATIARRKDFEWLAGSVEFLASNFAYCLWPALNTYLHQKTLHVAVLMDANFNFTLPLLALLNELTFVEVIPYEKNMSADEVDLLICANFELIPASFAGETFVYTHVAIADNFNKLKTKLYAIQEQAYLKAYQLL